MSTKNRCFLALITAFFFIIGCGEKKWHGRVEIVNGIEIISNPEQGLLYYTDIVISDELILGENMEMPLYKVSAVETDEAGCYYIADEGNYRIIKLNSTGLLVDEFGKKGSGPGEFQSLTCMKIKNETIYILDARQRRLHILSLNGTLLKSIILDFNPRYFSFIDQDHMLFTVWEFGKYGAYANKYNIHNGDTGRLMSVDFISDVNIPLGTSISLGERFEVLSTENILLVRPFPYELLIYHADGALYKKITKEDSRIQSPKIELLNNGKSISITERGAAGPGYTLHDGTYVVNCSTPCPVKSYLDFFGSDGKYLSSVVLNGEQYLVGASGMRVIILDKNHEEKVIIKSVKII